MSKQAKAKTYTDRVDWAVRLLKGIEKPIIVEVGVYKADYGYWLLKTMSNLTWYGVDPYMPYGKRSHHDPESPRWGGLFKRIVAKMSIFKTRAILIRKPSLEAVDDFPDNVDLIWLDGNHNYEYVLAELPLYEKKLKKGGILAGHDYAPKSGGPRKAVDEYLEHHDRKIIHESFDPAGVFWWRVE